jgi:hypothetical protein
MLKKRWQSATCQPDTGSSVTMEAAMMPVSVVPMLAPNVSGIMSSRQGLTLAHFRAQLEDLEGISPGLGYMGDQVSVS